MFINRSNNVQKLGNLKPLLRTKTLDYVSALINAKQQNRFTSSNDGVNDENFENPNSTTTATASSTDQNDKQQLLNKPTNPTKNKNLNNNKTFIEINLFGPKDARLPLPGNLGFAPKKYLNLNSDQGKIRKTVEKEFKLIKDHNSSSKECLTTTIEFNLNNYETIDERQNRVLENVVYNHKDEMSLERNQNKFKSLFFVKVYSSTHFLVNDLKQIFPKECLFEKDFVIITVYKNPFSKLANLNLKDEFVNLANGIADSLNRVGCWVNFLEPDSKRSYTDLVNLMNLDSDERFINYGVEVENHADCKLINHVNNAKLFIGTVFTTAKMDSLELNRVLKFLTKF